uniref:Fe2OG dioxygenase domain-containing protein n=1 Tax=Romanomermis culicivorax TaxID=13658 RepID=A0A915HHA0_ROMCU
MNSNKEFVKLSREIREIRNPKYSRYCKSKVELRKCVLSHLLFHRSRSRGYIPFETLNVRAFMGEFGYPNDAIERFLLGPTTNSLQISDPGDASRDYMTGWGPNVYHECFRESAIKFYNETVKLCHVIMQIMSSAMDMPPNFLHTLCGEDDHSMSVAHYPVVEHVKEKQDRAGEHKDISLFTVILQDEIKGALKLRNSLNELVAANSPSPDAFLLLLGEPLQIITNDFWPALSHVVPLNGSNDDVDQSFNKWVERTSVPFFVKLDKNALIQPSPKFLMENGGCAKYEAIPFSTFAHKMQNLYKKNYRSIQKSNYISAYPPKFHRLDMMWMADADPSCSSKFAF